MGCFNKTGFFSHLPITCGDDIALFVCADTYTGKYRKDDTPIGIRLPSTTIRIIALNVLPIVTEIISLNSIAFVVIGVYNDGFKFCLEFIVKVKELIQLCYLFL